MIYLLGSPTFWLSIFLVYVITFSLRMIERGIHAIWFPSDMEILAEHHALQKQRPPPVDQPPSAEQPPHATTMEMQEVTDNHRN